ncbi:LPXTG cell wall anchor domain-containing protein [Streptomyces sp. NPDC001828]|uniref:LPXTG cell wall anchor domain-containing protein n=1 Tax=Streptomyces sp. NPDC001828 TaxID=3364615 RepID=UPI0036CA5F87
MNIRRILATTVAAAVTAPAALLSVSPAFAAEAKPAAQTQKSTFEELKKAAADAAKAYDAAAKAYAEQRAIIKKVMADDAPEAKAYHDAMAAATKAGESKTAADKAVTEAKAKLAALPETAGADETAAAQKAVADAEATAKEAAAALATAVANRASAGDALDDLRVAATRKYSIADNARTAALKTKDAADAALRSAKECVRLPALSAQLKGLPAQVVAGTSVDFSFQVHNGTDRTLDALHPLFFVHAAQAKAQWLDGSVWKELKDEPDYVASQSNVKPGSTVEVKIRLTVDAKSPATHGDALIAGDASDQYNPCIEGPMKGYKFKVLAAGSKPDGDTAKPGPTDGKDRPEPTAKPAGGGSTPTAQGGAAATPLKTTGTTTGATTGALASTGSSSAVPQLALAGGAAVVLGAGAVFVTRRRKAADRT